MLYTDLVFSFVIFFFGVRKSDLSQSLIHHEASNKITG
jgi:hypothetical protein